MTGSAGYTATTANLVAMGGTSIPDYLQGAFPPAPPTGDSPAAPFEFSVEALGLSDPTNSSSGTNTPTDAAEERMEEEQEAEVPFYIKVRGKGKGKPIMYDRSKSSVAQIYELAAQAGLPEPAFTTSSRGAAHFLSFAVEVSFDGLTANNTDFAGSIKEGKELACSRLAELILARNRGRRLTA